MADTKTLTIRNTASGARGINTADRGLVMIEAGQSAEVTLGAADAELPDYFEEGEARADAEPGPLDGSIPDLEAHLAGIDDPDEIQRLIDAETAGKSRKGALDVLEARRDELLGG